MNNSTFRIFSLVAYDDSRTLNYSSILERLNTLPYSYFIIKHFPETDDKKVHYHIALYLKSPRKLKNIATLLNIPENCIKVLDEKGQRYTLKKTIGYFLHYNNKDKKQYSKDDIITNDLDTVNKYYDVLTGGSNEVQELKEIFAFIEDNNATISELMNFCLINNFSKTLKKYSYLLSQVCRERSIYR